MAVATTRVGVGDAVAMTGADVGGGAVATTDVGFGVGAEAQASRTWQTMATAAVN